MSKTFEAFKFRDYRLLWIGNLCMTIAVWIQTTTMSWVAYSLTGTGSTIGVVNAMRMIPTLVMAPIAGVFGPGRAPECGLAVQSSYPRRDRD